MAQNVTKRVVSVFVESEGAEKNLRDLTKESRQLYNELVRLPKGSQEFIDKSKEFRRVQGEIKGIRDEINGTGGMFGKLTGALGPLGAAIGGLFAVDAVIGFGKESVQAFQQAEMAMAKVQQAITSTGGAAGFSMEELKKRSDELQATTLFDGDDILNKASLQLLTFTNIADEQFMRAQNAALDLATVLDGDLQSSSIMIGKALNDPVKGLTALSKAGIQFSDEQRTMVNSLVEANDLIGAQTIILGELERQYGGQAEAAAKAEGGTTQITRAWGDFQEELGGALMSIFDTADGTSVLTTGIGYLTDGLLWLVQGVKDVRTWFIDLYNNSMLLRAGIGDAMIVIKTAWDAVVLSFRVGYEAIVTPIKAIGALLTGDFKGAFYAVRDGVVNVFSSAKDFAMDVVQNVSETIDEVNDPKAFAPLEAAAAATKPLVKVAVEVEGGDDPALAAMSLVRDTIKKAQEDIRRDRLTGAQREIEDVQNKYAALIEQAAGHTEEIKQLEELREQEIRAIRVKAGQKDVERLKKLDEDLNAIREEQRRAKLSKEEQEDLKALDRFTKLEEAARGNAARLQEIEVLKDEAMAQLRAKRAEEEAKRREEEAQRDAEWEATIDQQRQEADQRRWEQLEQRHAMELEMAEAQGIALDELATRQLMERLEIEQERYDADLELINERFAELYAIADLQGQDTTELQRLHGEAITALKTEYSGREIQLRKNTDAAILDSQKKRGEAERMIANTIMSITRDLYVAAGADADEMAGFNKAVTLFQIGLDTAAAISALTANSEANPANAVTGGAAAVVQFLTGFARITANIAKARQVLSKEKPTPPEFYVGGGTSTTTVYNAPSVSSGGVVGRKTLGWFGERGSEWVAPNWMYEHPTMQPLFAHLEYVRTTGAIPAFEVGGSTKSPSVASMPAAMETGNQMAHALTMLTDTMLQLQGTLSAGIPAVISNDQLEDNTERLDLIRNGSQLR